jgi:phenylacetate-coenzyme A ligase PaaK-like adenylate-forming protein
VTWQTLVDERDRFAYTARYEAACAQAVEEALDGVPAYAGWRALDPGPGVAGPRRLAGMPEITKHELRTLGPAAFAPRDRDVAQGLARGEIALAHTSGTTGDRVTNVWYQPWWDASERASWQLNAHASAVGLGGHREAVLTSAYCVGVPCEDGYLSAEQRSLGRFLYLNERSDPVDWTPEHMDRMIAEIDRFEPVVLEASPPFLARLARYAARTGRAVRSPRLIVLTYENPSALHLRDIRAVFSSPVASSYGSTEAGYVLMECERGRMHQNTESCAVDFLPFSAEHGGPRLGLILATTFGNPWRALLRFDAGDIVALDGGCPCGRGDGLTAASVEGRAVNLTLDTRGCAVTQARVDRALAAVDGLLEYQVVQLAPATYQLRVVPAARERQAVLGDAREALMALYGGDALVAVSVVDAVRPDPPGKYRLTRALFPIDARELVDPRFLPRRAPI